ncbi:piggyBac transposable element-derived protein 4-like [Palaemon carinicauda]|uniref:piggyBac transposable element-derived protein 4-like n=1 Tax=Palaemon carinicauda TaxID=392227 RepID=UPI0035B5A1F1
MSLFVAMTGRHNNPWKNETVTSSGKHCETTKTKRKICFSKETNAMSQGEIKTPQEEIGRKGGVKRSVTGKYVPQEKKQYQSIATDVILTPPKHICDADAMPSTSAPPTIINKKRHLQNLTPSKFLPMLFSEDETDEDTDDDINCGDSDSGEIGTSDDSEDDFESILFRSDGGDIEESEEDEENEIGNMHKIREGNIQSYIWSDINNFIPDIHPFDGNCAGITNEWPCEDTARENEYFLALFNEELVDLIVCETNKYYRWVMEKFSFTQNSRVHKWVDTDVHEIYVYFALLLLMPLMKKHVLQDYWKQDPLIPTPIFPKFMTRDRFLLLTRFMHFADNGRPIANDRIWKIRSFLSIVVANFKKVFHPFQKIVIDESLILFKGRLVFKQYIPSKRHRFGIKLFVLCDCETGIVLDIIVYTGTDIDIPKEDQSSGLGFSRAVVKKMMAPYMGHGHILYTDNWYSSPTLAQFLHDNATGACGTVRESRKYMPKFDVPSTSYDNPSDSDSPNEDETTNISNKTKKKEKNKSQNRTTGDN